MDFVELPDDELDKMLRITADERTAVAGWIIDRYQLEKAYDYCELTRPLKVKLHSKGVYTYGTHYVKFGSHLIVLNSNRVIENAEVTLWHELRHAMQAETYGGPIDEFYKDYKDNKGEWGQTYKGNYYEIDARDFADKHPFNILKEVK